MPITLKPNKVSFKDANGEYFPQDVISDYDTADLDAAVAQMEADVQSGITQIEQKTAESIASIPADYTTLSGDVSDLKSAVGAEVFEFGGTMLGEIKPVSLNESGIVFDVAPENFNTACATNLIPLPATLDGKITHNGYGYGNFLAIMFYDQEKAIISGAVNRTSESVETPIPNDAAYFRLGRMTADGAAEFNVSFNLSAAEKVQYLLKLMRLSPDCYVYDFDIKDKFVFPHTEISPTTGEETYSASSNYSATDFITIPGNLLVNSVGSYGYTGSGRSRVAFYDENKIFISADSSKSQRLRPVTIPTGAVYVRFGTHSTIPPESCLAYACIKNTNTDEEIIDLIRQALV